MELLKSSTVYLPLKTKPSSHSTASAFDKSGLDNHYTHDYENLRPKSKPRRRIGPKKYASISQ